jgi:hypothetical protein
MTRSPDANKNGPRHNAPRARGQSSRLTRLSLVGLLLSRAPLRFTEQGPLWVLETTKQLPHGKPAPGQFKTVKSASRVGDLKTVKSASRLSDQIPTYQDLAIPRFCRIIQHQPTAHPTLPVFRRR